jgi:mRNA interferase MazF
VASILRGDICWADLEPVVGHEQGGRRPVLIISRTHFNDRSGTVIAVAITSAEPKAGFPFTLELKKTQMGRRAWVKISQVRTLSTKRLAGRITSCISGELEQVIEGLNQLITRP